MHDLLSSLPGTIRPLTVLAARALLASALLAAPAAAEVDVSVGPTGLTFSPTGEFERATLRVSGRDGVVVSTELIDGDTLTYALTDAAGAPLADGAYVYEFVVRPVISVEEHEAREGDEALSDGGIQTRRRPVRRRGAFRVEGGVLSDHLGDGPPTETDFTDNLCAGSAACGDPLVDVTADIVAADFSNDPPQIQLTQYDAGTTTNIAVWEMSGGPHFTVEDEASFSTPMTIAQGAPDDSMFVGAGGYLGLGTNAPATSLHLATDGSGLRIENAVGSTWDLRSDDDLSIDLVDDGNGVSVPEIMVFENEENMPLRERGVGIFERNPRARLHVGSPDADGSAKLRVQEKSPVVETRALVELINNGSPRLELRNEDQGVRWQVAAFSSDSASALALDEVGDPAEFIVRRNGTIAVGDPMNPLLDVMPNGDVRIMGLVVENSNAEAKQAVRPVDSGEVLEKLAQLPISTWSYKSQSADVRHLGPMAQDFHAAFGLGNDETGLASLDAAGVALAAIQGLQGSLVEKETAIAELKRSNAELVRANSALETRLAEVEALVVLLAEAAARGR